MGRPISKKYLGGRNRGADGNLGALNTAGDADLGGTSVSGVGSITAGTYTVAPTLQFPVPLLAADGGVRATGTPYFTPVAGQITVGGTQTQAYSASDVITQATTGVTYTPTLTTYSANSFTTTAVSSNVLVLTSTITAVKGTSIVWPAGASGVTGLTPGQTYYLAASVSASANVTLAATPTGSVLTISGTPAGTLTGINIGASLASIASVVYAGGSVTTLNTTALATTASVSAGAGMTLAVAQWGIAGATITNAGSTYSPASTNTISITASTAGAALSVGTVTSGTTGNFTFSTAQTAGTFWVGQVITVTGTIGGTTWTGYSTGNNYIVSATNGTSTITLVAMNSATGVANVAQTTSAGTTTGLTFTTAGTVTVSTPDGLIPSGQKFVTTGTGGSSGVTAGTYFIIAVNSSTNQVSLASTYANFFTSTPVSITTAASITSTTGVGSQHLVININGGTGSGGAISAVLLAEVTTGYAGKYASIIGMAIVGANGTLRQGADLIKQENSRRYKVETQDGIGYCTLVAALPTAAGQVAINATDYNGSTYWVQKLNNRKCTIRRNTVSGSFQFADGAQVPWTFGAAATGYSVKIDNI
jgi:hypothetical protein